MAPISLAIDWGCDIDRSSHTRAIVCVNKCRPSANALSTQWPRNETHFCKIKAIEEVLKRLLYYYTDLLYTAWHCVCHAAKSQYSTAYK